MSHQCWRHWSLAVDSDRIAWLSIDSPNKKVNTLHTDVLDEFEQALDCIRREGPRGLVIYSEKPSGFAAGADINQFRDLRDSDSVRHFMARGQSLLSALEKLETPSLALIHGACLGGGLELALACDYRIADPNSTILGLPEVCLGLIPAWGGTVRLTRLIGPRRALPLLMAGSRLSASDSIGIVDSLVDRGNWQSVAVTWFKQHSKKARSSESLFCGYRFLRVLVGAVQRLRLKMRAYSFASRTASYAILNHWEKCGVTEAAFEDEIKQITGLLLSSASRALVDRFLAKRG